RQGVGNLSKSSGCSGVLLTTKNTKHTKIGRMLWGSAFRVFGVFRGSCSRFGMTRIKHGKGLEIAVKAVAAQVLLLTTKNTKHTKIGRMLWGSAFRVFGVFRGSCFPFGMTGIKHGKGLEIAVKAVAVQELRFV
ncbi:MAG: hypothetical protein ACK5OB_15065, partial [Pirellula sp.]